MDSGPGIAFLDTHAAVFLWEGRADIWGLKSRWLLERVPLFISPLVRLELGYLKEIGKLKVGPDEIVGGLQTDCGVIQSQETLTEVISQAMTLHWTRDPFDRLIAATAMVHRAALITRDRRILDNMDTAVW